MKGVVVRVWPQQQQGSQPQSHPQLGHGLIGYLLLPG